MSINWGGYVFESIKKLSTWNPPTKSGIYGIMFKKNPISQPYTYNILYFGEANDFSTRGIGTKHHKYSCWKYHAYQKELYVNVFVTHTEPYRKNVEKELIQKYKPDCNDIYV